jgi:rod shape determining protein RodA
MIRSLEKRFGGSFDWSLLINIVAICGVGLGVLFSAGYDAETGMSIPMQKQAIFMGVGLVVYFIVSLIDSSFWRRWALLFYAMGCIFLLAIDVVGVAAGGARRWLDLGVVRMQPSEFVKIAIILVLARVLSSEKAPDSGYTLGKLMYPVGVLAMPFVLTLIQPDLGTALCQALIGGSMILIAGIHGRTLLSLVGCGIAMLFPAWGMLHDYQKKRVLNFLSPEMDPLGSGYHAIQSKIAVGSGAITGKGFLEGTQTQLRFLPEQTTDFFFSVLAEEWGFLGSALAILLYGFLIYQILRICSRADDRFQAFVCIGVAALVFWHVIVNIGMVTGVLPVVGITLPLLSYGGSSVVTQLVALGIVARVSSKRFMFAS